MAQARRHLLLALMALPLGACGLKPLYGRVDAGGADVAAELAQVAVPEQQTRHGQLVRNQLLSIMQGDNTGARYVLQLTVTEQDSDASALPGTSTVRHQYKLSGSFRLVDQASKSLMAGSLFASADYDTVRQPVSDLQAKRDAMERVALELAQDIRLRVAAYFSAQKG